MVCEELLVRCEFGAEELSDALEAAYDAAEAGDFSDAARLLRASWNRVPWSVQHEVGLKLAPLVVSAAVLCSALSEPARGTGPGRFAVEVASQLQERGLGDTPTALVSTMAHTSTMTDVEEMLLASERITAEPVGVSSVVVCGA